MKRLLYSVAAGLLLPLCLILSIPGCGNSAPLKVMDSGNSKAGTDPVPQPVVNEKIAVQPMDMTETAPVSVKKLDTSPDSRRVVNTENPMFLFRVFLGVDNMMNLWNILPEDIREYTVIQLDYDQTDPIDKHLPVIEEMLNKADEEGIPVLWQIENWNSWSTREGFEEEELVAYLDSHPSLIGYAHTELSCNYTEQEEIDRMKTTLRACMQKNALLVWFDMEYWHNTNVFARFLEDEELYELMSSYSHNVVMMDKHNGQGRHFAVQSGAMGMWLADLCGSWGSNVESWIWYEEGLGQYDDMGGTHRCFPWYYIRQYPAAMFGIDILNDAVGGACVFSFEEGLMTLTNSVGKTVWTPSFYSICYPIYQKIAAGNLIPSRGQVKEKVKAAYQYTDIDADIFKRDAQGLEASLFIDLYGPTREWIDQYKRLQVSKKWLPTTGRYYIVPSLPKQADASVLLPDAEIVTAENAFDVFGGREAEHKQAYFNSRYAEFYTGSATMYDMGGYSLLFNNHENITQNSEQDAQFTLDSDKNMKITLPEHTYGLLYEDGGSLSLELYNYRYDVRDCLNEKESLDAFHAAFLKGKRDSNVQDFRTITVSVGNLTVQPQIRVCGTNNASAASSWDPENGMLTVTVTMNGAVYLDIRGLE